MKWQSCPNLSRATIPIQLSTTCASDFRRHQRKRNGFSPSRLGIVFIVASLHHVIGTWHRGVAVGKRA
jgi:hypothetical protein